MKRAQQRWVIRRIERESGRGSEARFGQAADGTKSLKGKGGAQCFRARRTIHRCGRAR